MAPAMELSVVVPVHNEADNVAPLIGEIAAALDGRVDYEIVYVDDASTDGTVAALGALKAGRPRLRVVRHAERCGQSAAIRTGVRAACAPWIATLDGDGQNDPADLPSLWALRRDEAVMIAGERTKRHDPWSKRGATVESVPVNHRPRLKGTSKYGFWDRLWVGIVDLLGVMWLQRRARIPRTTED
ncbi:MAG: glycosyltransferase family 2 protein [Proteobacteria bacterium]|nr:glycosyltransferase family 2 protein [Pseudomonadota bacterium]